MELPTGSAAPVAEGFSVHGERRIKKTIYTLNLNGYAPAIRELTYPLMHHYARKINADFVEITERRFPDWPITLEKWQVARLAVERDDEWSIFLDADTLVSPEMFDPTELVHKDTVFHNGKDFANIRWTYDKYFRRDGRNIGSCTWFIAASDLCVEDLYHFPDLPLEECLRRIHITIQEANGGQCKTEHLVDDFNMSRNIARFGLKFRTVQEIGGELGWKMPDGKGISPYLFHMYSITMEEKLGRMLDVLTKPQAQGGWQLMGADQAAEFKKRWGLK